MVIQVLIDIVVWDYWACLVFLATAIPLPAWSSLDQKKDLFGQVLTKRSDFPWLID